MIRYPIARLTNGAAIHIDAWTSEQVTCFGCGQELDGHAARDGIKLTAHFAHKAESICNNEIALVKATRAAIVHGCAKFLVWGCPHCLRFQHQTELQSFDLREETSPCPGVVSDVLGLGASDDPRIAIDMSDVEAKLARYEELGLFAFSLKPSWNLVGELSRGGTVLLHVVHRCGSVSTATCEGCKQLLREHDEWEARARGASAAAWWILWIKIWDYIGKEAVVQREAQDLLLETQTARVEAWWSAWTRVWPRMIEHRTMTWWLEWRRLWREIGAEYTRPQLWMRSWLSAWRNVTKQYAAEEISKALQRAKIEDRERARREAWWPAWLNVWADIAKRESGLMAAWKPICRQCRQDLVPDHVCP